MGRRWRGSGGLAGRRRGTPCARPVTSSPGSPPAGPPGAEGLLRCEVRPSPLSVPSLRPGDGRENTVYQQCSQRSFQHYF